MTYYHLALALGTAESDEGVPVVWAACPDLPGAYEEAADETKARERLRDLARRIIAEHLVREDPLDAAIVASATPPDPIPADTLLVAISDADLTAAREAPLLVFEVPEP